MFNINNIILFLKIVNSILLILFQIINQNKYQKLYSMLKNINLILTLIINILSIINFDLLHWYTFYAVILNIHFNSRRFFLYMNVLYIFWIENKQLYFLYNIELLFLSLIKSYIFL